MAGGPQVFRSVVISDAIYMINLIRPLSRKQQMNQSMLAERAPKQSNVHIPVRPGVSPLSCCFANQCTAYVIKVFCDLLLRWSHLFSPAHHPQGRRLTGQCATACAHPVCCRIPGLTHDSLSRLPCGCPSLRAVSPTIGRAEAHPSSIAVSCCAWALHSGGDPRLQLSALRFMQECETAFTVRCGRKNLFSIPGIHDQLALVAFS